MAKREVIDCNMSGAALIFKERQRQIQEEGWSEEHDDQHFDSSLSLAAVCYASPIKLYLKQEYATGITFDDPWPWLHHYDKRFRCGERKQNAGNTPPDPKTYNNEERVDLLIKAGALIAAEIDRLQRKERRYET